MHTPQAWLRLDTTVVEKTDYLTGRNVRYLRVDTPDLPSSQADAAGGRVHTPPPRENGEGPFSGGGGSGKAPGPAPLSGWAPPTTNISPGRLFGDTSSGPTAAAAMNGGSHEGVASSAF